MNKSKDKMKIVRLIRNTPGGSHAWYEAEITAPDGTVSIVEIRKPTL